MAAPRRQTARVVPPHPITVAIQEDSGAPFAFGVMADISETGACVWTDADLVVGATLAFRISFANPSDVHEAVGVVVWSEKAHHDSRGTRRSGVAWVHATRQCHRRLLDLAGRAMRPHETEDYPYQARWTVRPPVPPGAQPGSVFRGSVELVGATGLLQVCNLNRLTGTLVVRAGPQQIRVSFRRGEVVGAVGVHLIRSNGDELKPTDIVYRLLEWSRGQFQFIPARYVDGEPMAASFDELLLEGHWRLDERQRQSRGTGSCVP